MLLLVDTLRQDLLMTLEAQQDEWKHRLVPTPSNSGNECIRELWTRGRGIPRTDRVPASNILAMEQGKSQEGIVYNLFRRLGYEVEEQVEVPPEAISCAEPGTADAIITDLDGRRSLLEVKRLGWWGFLKMAEAGLYKAHRNYYTQVQLYMKGLDLDEAVVVVLSADYSAVKLFWKQRRRPLEAVPPPLLVEIVTRDDNFCERQIERNELIMALIAEEDNMWMVPRVADPVVNDGWPCTSCGWRQACIEAGEEGYEVNVPAA